MERATPASAGSSTNLANLKLLRFAAKKAKKGKKTGWNLPHAERSKMEENMKSKITKGKRKNGSNEPDAIDKLEKIASTAIEVYRVVKPVAKAILKNRRKK